jgi:ABC-type amino acid transport substrate-binding protein
MRQFVLPVAAAFTLVAAQPAAAQDSGTLKKIKDTGSITLGHRDTSIPFSYYDDKQQVVGYAMDICMRIVDAVKAELKLQKLDVKWVPVTVDTRMQAVANGAIDLECGSTTNTLSRQEQVDFSNMTFVDGGSLLVKTTGKLASFQDFAGKKIGVIPGTTTETALKAALQKALVNAQVTPVKDHREGLTGVESGTLDAYASDRVILIGLAVTAKDPSQFAIADTYLSYEPYGLMLRRGDAAFRLTVNRALAQLYRSGEVLQIYGRWFGKLGQPGNLLVAMYALNALPE